MNLKNLKIPLNKVQDLTEEEQTPELKKELYDMITPFVRKYQPELYKQYRGDLQDLVSDFYVKFMTRKGRGDLKENLLDKFDPSVTVLPYLVKIAVRRALIDQSRGDKGAFSIGEGYNANDRYRLSTDYVSTIMMKNADANIEDMEFSEEFIEEMKGRFDGLDTLEQNRFRKALVHYRKKHGLHSNFDKLFGNLEDQLYPKKAQRKGSIKITGIRPDYTITYTEGDEVTETKARSRNMESVLKKANRLYPGAKIEDSHNFDYLTAILELGLSVTDSLPASDNYSEALTAFNELSYTLFLNGITDIYYDREEQLIVISTPVELTTYQLNQFEDLASDYGLVLSEWDNSTHSTYKFK